MGGGNKLEGQRGEKEETRIGYVQVHDAELNLQWGWSAERNGRTQ